MFSVMYHLYLNILSIVKRFILDKPIILPRSITSLLFGPMLVGLTKCDKALPALLGEAESAWPEAPTLGGLQK